MQLYPPLINLLETTVEEDTLFTKLKGGRVRSPEDLPRRVIAGLLDPESFQYSEADGDKQWQATWKSWNDELRLEVSWSASNGWYGCFYWKNWPLLAGEGRAETTFGVIFLHFRGIYSQVQRCPYSMDLLPLLQDAFFWQDGLRLMLFMPIHAKRVRKFWEMLQLHREQMVTSVTARVGLVEAKITKPADDYLGEFSPINLFKSTGVRFHLGQDLIDGHCCATSGIYVAGVHFGLADLPLIQSIWKEFPPERPYFCGCGMDISTAKEATWIEQNDAFREIQTEDWQVAYRMTPTLRSLFSPSETVIPAPCAETGLEMLDDAIKFADLLGY